MSSAQNGIFSISDNQELLLDHKAQLIFSASQLKGIDMSLDQARGVIDYAATESFNPDDVALIMRLVDAFRYILINTTQFTFQTIQRINALIMGTGALGAGVVRKKMVSPAATMKKWVPPIPDKGDREAFLIALLTSRKPVTSQALDLFLDICRMQYFTAGNQRTALFAANNLLLTQGAGLLMIPLNKMGSFQELLADFCLSGEDRVVKQWLSMYCLVN